MNPFVFSGNKMLHIVKSRFETMNNVVAPWSDVLALIVSQYIAEHLCELLILWIQWVLQQHPHPLAHIWAQEIPKSHF